MVHYRIESDDDVPSMVVWHRIKEDNLPGIKERVLITNGRVVFECYRIISKVSPRGWSWMKDSVSISVLDGMATYWAELPSTKGITGSFA